MRHTHRRAAESGRMCSPQEALQLLQPGLRLTLRWEVCICSRIKMRWKQTLRTDSGSELLEGIFTLAGWITGTGAAVHHRDTVFIKGSFMLWTQMASMSVPADHKIFTSQTALCALFLPVLLPPVEPGSMRVTTQWPVNHHSLKKCRMCVYKTTVVLIKN